MSYYSLTYHIVFSTYSRQNTIDALHERELYAFMNRFATERNIKVRRIGGMPDHVHLLCDIPPKLALADFVRLLKCETSKFLTANEHFPCWNGWSEGYGAFTVDASMRETRRQYIMNQKEHHAVHSFQEELDELIQRSY